MADFSERIARARVVATAVPSPVLDISSLGVITSKQVGQYTHYTADYGNSQTIPQLPIIPAAQLPTGTKWLVYAGASIGSGDTAADGMVQVFASLAPGASGLNNFSRGWAECVSHGTPESQRGSHTAKMFVFTSTGGDDLVFAISNTQGNTQPQPDGNPEGVMIQGAILVAVPFDDFTQSQNGGDYWQSATELFTGAEELTTTTQTFQTVRSTNYTVVDPGEYLVVACCDVNSALSQTGRVRLTIDGLQQHRPWQKVSADSRDIHSYFYAHPVTLGAGAHTFAIEGASLAGTGEKKFSRSVILILKLSAFGSYAWNQTTDFSVSNTYPDYQNPPIVTVGYTPYVDGEYVLVIGNGMAKRNSAAALSIRLYDHTLNRQVGQEFCSLCHPPESMSLGLTTDSPSFTAVAAELVNTPTIFSIQGAVEAGYPNPMIGSGDTTPWPMTIIALGMTKRTGPEIVTLNGMEVVSVVDTTTAPLDGSFAHGEEMVTTAEQGSVSAVSPGPSLPTIRPRLWVYGNNRLAYWQAQAAGNTADWQNFLDSREYGDRPWHYALRYLITGTTTYRDQCISALQAERAARPIYSGNLFGDQWQNARGYCRSWALIYDWLYNEPALTADLKEYLEDSLLATVYVLYHANSDAVARTIYPGGTKTGVYDEGVNQPNQNFWSTYHFCAMYAAAALAPNKTTFRTIPGDNTSALINFEVQFNYKNPSQGPKPWYSDLLEFVRDRLDYLAYPVWQVNYAGGGWNEGSAYGVGVGMFQGEVQALFQAFGWPDTANPLNIPFYRDLGKFHIYQSQPRNQITVSYGEAAGTSPSANVSNYMRHAMLSVAYIYSDSYIQWWLNNVMVAMGSFETNEERPFDLLMGKRDLAELDYRTAYPLHYHASGIGFFNTRSSWNDDAVSVSLRCGILVRNHACEDNNSLMLFKSVTGAGAARDGWILCDPAHFFASGEKRDHVFDHNTYSLFESTPTTEGPSYPNGWRQRFTDYSPVVSPQVDRRTGNATYAYGRGNAHDIYWQLKWTPPSTGPAHGGSLRRQINDVFQREVFHLKAGSYVVVFDRFRVLPAYARPDTNAQARWHWSNSQPTNLGGGVLRHDNVAGARTYQRMFDGEVSTWDNMNTSDGINVYRQKVDHLIPTGYMDALTVFEVCDNPAKGAITDMVKTPVTGLGFTPGTMKGVTIKETTRKHILFSAEQDGATPGTVSYYVEKNDDGDQHYVCNMVPGQEYFIDETDLGSGYFRYTLTSTFNIGFVANSAGVVEFTPIALSNQGALPLVGEEIVPGPTETSLIVVTHAVTIEGDEEVVGTVDTGNLNDGGDTVTIIGSEVVPGPTETPGYGINIDGNETVSVSDESVMEAVGPAPFVYNEKIITPNSLIMVPSSDRGVQYVLPEPNDGIYFDKINDASPLTFVRFGPDIFSAYFSNLYVGLSVPGPYVGRAVAVQFTAYIRKCEISGSNGPVLIFNLYDDAPSGANFIQHNMGLIHVNEAQPTTIQSGWLPCNIPANKLSSILLRMQTRVTSFQNFQLDLYYVTVEVRGNVTQKVISG